MTIVDWIIVAVAVLYAVSGFRNGAVVGAFSLVGFFGGALIGAQIAQPVSSHVASGRAQVGVAVACVLLCAILLQVALGRLGWWLRSRITWRPMSSIDAGIGALLGVLSVLLVAWMVAVPLASSPYPSLVRAVDQSTIVREVDGVMPNSVRNVYSSLREFVDRSGFPPVLGDLHSTRIVDVPPPNTALANSPAVAGARGSVYKIRGDAPSCDRGIEGTGFVYAPEHVLTNAHVVAGTESVQLESGTHPLTAHVVLFDPRRDVAVLFVPGLSAPPLPFAPKPAVTNADAVVLGYPEDRGFDAETARIRSRNSIIGQDIYGSQTVQREVYAIRSLVRSGNSGGPLIDTKGRVLGIVFATARDSPDTGFVLTNAEVAADAAAGRTGTAPVSTSACTP
jgi:S1-C subfamily serine protease